MESLHKIDIAEIKAELAKKNDESFRRPESVRIYNARLTDVDKEAYAPRWVSLGPYHHNAAHLPPMQTHKLRAVKRMLDRLGCLKPNISCFEGVVHEIQKLDCEIRNSYEQVIGFSDKDLAWMMAIDGCFVLEIITTLSGGSAEAHSSSFDPIFDLYRMEYTGYVLLTDMLLLENQIPLCVLIKILELELGSNEEAAKELSWMLANHRLTGRLFYPFIINAEDAAKELKEQVEFEITSRVAPRPAHLLDLASRLAGGPSPLARFPQPNIDSQRGGSKPQHLRNIPTVSELHDVGVKFKGFDGGVMHIKFIEEKATLELPVMNISTSVEIILRNLMAYQIFQSSSSTDMRLFLIPSFAILMDELVNDQRDVALLRRYGIIRYHTLGSDKQVADFFNSLCKGMIIGSHDIFMDERKAINDYYHSKYRVMFAEFVKEHFSSPWRAASVGAATVLLILTLLQTIFTIRNG